MSLNEGAATPHFNVAAQGVDAYVGSRIRQCRVDRGRSLQSLAAQLNMRSEQLETYESGKDRMTASQLKELANALDVPLSYFFDGLAAQLDKLRAADTRWRSLGALLKGPLLLSIAYYLGAQAAFFLGTLSDRIFAPFWPPNVILFCALLFVPYKRWWHYAAAAIPAHILAELQVGMPMLQIAVAFATNCMVAFLSAAGVRGLLGGPPWFDSFQRASVYIVITAVVSPGVAALGGAFVRISEGAALESYGLFWAQWYLANALASLTLGPAILTCAEWRTDLAGSSSRWRQGEALLVAICLALTCVLVGHAAPLIAGRGIAACPSLFAVADNHMGGRPLWSKGCKRGRPHRYGGVRSGRPWTVPACLLALIRRRMSSIYSFSSLHSPCRSCCSVRPWMARAAPSK